MAGVWQKVSTQSVLEGNYQVLYCTVLELPQVAATGVVVHEHQDDKIEGKCGNQTPSASITPGVIERSTFCLNNAWYAALPAAVILYFVQVEQPHGRLGYFAGIDSN